jgi:hypothetical protein
MSDFGCKVCRVLEERDMKRYEGRLLEKWQGSEAERKGYRQLARWLNVTALQREMDRAGLSTLGGEAESKYERLQGEQKIADEITESLSQAGIDVSRLSSDFVSYGVVRTHIKECLGAEREVTSSDWEQDAIKISRDHAETKFVEAVRSLDNKGKLAAGGDISVHVTADIECEACQAQVPLERAVRRGYICDCGESS